MLQNNSTQQLERLSCGSVSTIEEELMDEIEQLNSQSFSSHDEPASMLGKMLQTFIIECIEAVNDPIIQKIKNDQELKQFLKQKKLRFSNLLKFFENQFINRYAEEFFGNIKWMRNHHQVSKKTILTTAALLCLSEILLKEVRKRKTKLILIQ